MSDGFPSNQAWPYGPSLLLSGGTMTGVIAMGANKITGLANGSVSTDAAAFGQIPTAVDGNLTIGGKPVSAASGLTTGYVLSYNGTSWVAAAASSGSGTVTSVSMTTPTWLSVAGSPITTAGTFAVTATTGQTANLFLATPDGTTGIVGLRAIVAGDVSSLSLSVFAVPSGDLSIGTHKLTNVVDPASPQDAATKNYVDTQLASLTPKADCQCATVTALAAATYNNGSSGVGATLTLTVAAVLVLDGYTPLLNDRILVKNQAAPAQNGIFSVTTLGTVLINAVLTRTTDFDQPAEVDGAITFIINGSTNAGTRWQCLASGTVTFGTTAINWSAFTGSTYSADGTTISLSGTTFSLITPVAIGNGGTGGTTSTGSGAVVLATSPTLITPALGTPASGNLSSCTNLPVVRTASFDGGGLPIQVGATTPPLYFPKAATIKSVMLGADVSGSAVLDVKACARTSYPGSLASIVASDPPTLSAAAQSKDSTLAGWTTAITADTMMVISVTSAATLTKLTITIELG